MSREAANFKGVAVLVCDGGDGRRGGADLGALERTDRLNFMSEPILSAQAFVNAGDLEAAEKELWLIRPGLRGELRALVVWSQIHRTRKHWSKLDVLCNLMRKDYPQERCGFSLGAESLHQQGRTGEAIELLEKRGTEAKENPDDLYALARYYCKLNNAPAAILLLQTAFGRDAALRDKAFSDDDLSLTWPGLQDSRETASSVKGDSNGV